MLFRNTSFLVWLPVLLLHCMQTNGFLLAPRSSTPVVVAESSTTTTTTTPFVRPFESSLSSDTSTQSFSIDILGGSFDESLSSSLSSSHQLTLSSPQRNHLLVGFFALAAVGSVGGAITAWAEPAHAAATATTETTTQVAIHEFSSSSSSLSSSVSSLLSSSSSLSSASTAATTTTTTTSLTATTTTSIDWSAILSKAGKRALGGGKAGASAAVVQVLSLMWLRTSMNYQYRYGGNLVESLQILWSQGGVARLYQGLPFALIQGPLTRFGDTAANVGILALLETLPQTQDWPLPLKTAGGSLAAGTWRIFLMPLDASKTALQVQGENGLDQLWQRVREAGPGSLYQGAFAQAAATAAGHFPWFLTYNFLSAELPVVGSDELLLSLVRAAGVGMAASCVSDCVSNGFRVIKTTKQTAQLSEGDEVSYPEVVAMIVEKDGWIGLLGRGLQTRLLTNAIQGAAFSILWKYFQQV